MNQYKKLTRILIILVAIGLIAFGIRLTKGIKDVNMSFREDLPITYTISSDDSSLIGKKYAGNLKAD